MLDSLAMASPACKAYSVSEVKGVTPTMNLGVRASVSSRHYLIISNPEHVESL